VAGLGAVTSSIDEADRHCNRHQELEHHPEASHESGVSAIDYLLATNVIDVSIAHDNRGHQPDQQQSDQQQYPNVLHVAHAGVAPEIAPHSGQARPGIDSSLT